MGTQRTNLSVRLELQPLSASVTRVTVHSMLQLNALDAKRFSSLLLDQMRVDDAGVFPLDDGSTLLVFGGDGADVSCSAIPVSDRDIFFDVDVELSDGKIYSMSVGLDQSTDDRRDFVLGCTRYIVLRGEASVEVDGDGTEEA